MSALGSSPVGAWPGTGAGFSRFLRLAGGGALSPASALSLCLPESHSGQLLGVR